MIGSSFVTGMQSSQNKVEFLSQFQLIVKGVQDSLQKQESVLARKYNALETQKKTLQQLMDEQRRYVSAVQEVQEECLKNDWLIQQLELRNIAS
mmetsp:Transcript_27166/g.27406  ORF Transcript_27166/g.27406 Transcript_27166/m.27406 type:complete len:94 (-) Transcript_27166:125-406(-)